jgi:hypothetical protein
MPSTFINHIKRSPEMIVKKRLFKTLITIGVTTMLLMPFAAADKVAFAADAAKRLDVGSTWVVNEATSLTSLIIAGGVMKAPEGYTLTMTVDGVEGEILPGAYKGKVVITPTEIIPFADVSHGAKYNLRTAIYVDNGAIVSKKSVSAAVSGGKVTGNSATDLNITSIGKEFNGIILTGDSKYSYSMTNPKINLTGDGANDFAGVGAAIMSNGNTDVTINKASIITNGCVRTAIWTGGHSIIHVNDSFIETGSPALPEGYKSPFTEGGHAMMRVPFMLGLTGTCRSTNLLEYGTAYYNNTQVKAHGWGAFSTDAGKGVKLYLTKCIIDVPESGYGAYSQGDAIFSGCIFNVADVALIGGGGNGVFTDGTVVNSGRFGVMFHGSGDHLTIDKGTVFNTKSTAIELKSAGTNIVVDNAQLNAENGILIQTMADDDPNKAGGASSERAPASAAAPAAPASAAPAPPAAVKSADVNATFSNVALKGDIVNGNTASGAVNVTFKKATITGAITTATIKNALGPNGEKITMNTPYLYKLIGEVGNTYCETGNKFGVTVSLDASSKWIVDKTSYLTSMTIAEGATIAAPKGYAVAMTIDGVKTEIKAGAYKGKIVLIVTKS